jgi:hypothetical protein
VSRAGELWRRGQAGWPRGYVLAQFPNAPLLLAIVAWPAQRLLDGEAADVAGALGTVGIVAWAWLELTAGVNAFRRLLGLVVLASVVAGLAGR